MEQTVNFKTQMSVLLIGNNPSDLSNIYEQLSKSRSITFHSEVAFSVSDIQKYIKKGGIDCVVIDDGMEKHDLKEIFRYLKNNSLTKELPITIVQNTNVDDAPRSYADEFILKKNVTTEAISKALFNSLKIHDMRNYLKEAYAKRKSQILAFK